MKHILTTLPTMIGRACTKAVFLDAFSSKNAMGRYGFNHSLSFDCGNKGHFTSTGKGPRKGWRTPLNTIICSEQRDTETGLSYYGARYYDSDLLMGWLSVDPMSDKYPSMSPYNYCAGSPLALVDPEGRDWYEPDKGGDPVWRKGNAKKITYEGKNYHNVGRYYTKANGGILTHYDQDKIVGTTDLNSDVGKKFSMIAAEGGWTKNEEGKTVRETQYGLYIIGASMENRLRQPAFFPNNGTYESLFSQKQYNAAGNSTYKDLASKLGIWKSWYGTQDVMNYLNAVYNAAHGDCVNILTRQYGFSDANKILGYAHKAANLFGKHSINLSFDKTNTLIKTVQSSDYVFPLK